MTGDRLPAVQATARTALIANADLLYRHIATWNDGTSCRFSVQDPNRIDTPLARSLRERPDAADVRVLKVHPDDLRPALAARLPWQGGVLFVERYAQTSDFTDVPPGICRFVDPARTVSYPLTFTAPGLLVVDPRTGNQRPGPGVPLPVVARLEAATDPQVRDAVGADAATVVLFGRWGAAGTPLPRPAGVVWGSSSPLTLQGQPGTLTVKLAWPDADPVQALIHGEAFISSWRAS